MPMTAYLLTPPSASEASQAALTLCMLNKHDLSILPVVAQACRSGGGTCSCLSHF